MGASQRKRRRERQRTHRFWIREIFQKREFRYFADGNAVHPGMVAVATIAGEWFPYDRCDRYDRPNGSDPILERTISVHTVPFRLSTSVHTGPVCYCSVLNRSKKSSCFYQLSMRRIHVVAFKMAPKYLKEPAQVFTR